MLHLLEDDCANETACAATASWTHDADMSDGAADVSYTPLSLKSHGCVMSTSDSQAEAVEGEVAERLLQSSGLFLLGPHDHDHHHHQASSPAGSTTMEWLHDDNQKVEALLCSFPPLVPSPVQCRSSSITMDKSQETLHPVWEANKENKSGNAASIDTTINKKLSAIPSNFGSLLDAVNVMMGDESSTTTVPTTMTASSSTTMTKSSAMRTSDAHNATTPLQNRSNQLLHSQPQQQALAYCSHSRFSFTTSETSTTSISTSPLQKSKSKLVALASPLSSSNRSHSSAVTPALNAAVISCRASSVHPPSSSLSSWSGIRSSGRLAAVAAAAALREIKNREEAAAVVGPTSTTSRNSKKRRRATLDTDSSLPRPPAARRRKALPPSVSKGKNKQQQHFLLAFPRRRPQLQKSSSSMTKSECIAIAPRAAQLARDILAEEGSSSLAKALWVTMAIRHLAQAAAIASRTSSLSSTDNKKSFVANEVDTDELPALPPTLVVFKKGTNTSTPTEIPLGFVWSDYPLLEQVLAESAERYFEIAQEKPCHGSRQTCFNNSLVAHILQVAKQHGYAFATNNSDSSTKELRDRVRAYYKTHLQNTKKRLQTMLAKPTKKASAQQWGNLWDVIQDLHAQIGRGDGGTAAPSVNVVKAVEGRHLASGTTVVGDKSSNSCNSNNNKKNPTSSSSRSSSSRLRRRL